VDTLTVRRMLFATLVVGAFWHIWNIFAGEIPALSSIALWTSWEVDANGDRGKITAQIINLPFSVSRSWDMLGAAILVWGLSRMKYYEKNPGFAFTGARSGVILGVLFSIVGLGSPVGHVLAINLTIGLVFATFFSLKKDFDPIVGLAYGLSYSLVISLTWIGLILAIPFFFVVTSPFWLFIVTRGTLRVLRNIEWRAAFARILREPDSTL